MPKKFNFNDNGFTDTTTIQKKTEKISYPKGQIVDIPIELIDIGDNIRNIETDSEQGLDELGASIKDHGQLEPCTVYEKNNKYILKLGSRRYKACIGADIPTLKCIVEDEFTNEKDRIIKQAIENEHRSNMSPKERENYMNSLIQLGMTQVEIANTLHKTKGWVSIALQAHEVREKNSDILSGLSEEPSTKDMYKASSLKKDELEKIVQEASKENGSREAFKKHLSKALENKHETEIEKDEESVTQDEVEEAFGIETDDFSEDITVGIHFTFTLNDESKTVIMKNTEDDLDSEIEKFVFKQILNFYKKKGYSID